MTIRGQASAWPFQCPRCGVAAIGGAGASHTIWRPDNLARLRTSMNTAAGEAWRGRDDREWQELMAPRFSKQWAMPLEPGLETHVSLIDHAGDHQEWRSVGADETDALTALWTVMYGDAAHEALMYAAS